MPVQRIETPDLNLNRVQSALIPPLNALLSIPLLDGRLIEGLILDSVGVDVEHKLARAVRGWLIVDIDDFATVIRSASADETKLLRLTASATVTVSLWVF